MDEFEIKPTPVDPSHPVIRDMYEQLERHPELADEIIEDAIFAYNPAVTNLDYDALLGRKPVPQNGEMWVDVWRSLFVPGTSEAAALDALLTLLPKKGDETDWHELYEQMTSTAQAEIDEDEERVKKAVRNRLDAITWKFQEAQIEPVFIWERGVIRRVQ